MSLFYLCIATWESVAASFLFGPRIPVCRLHGDGAQVISFGPLDPARELNALLAASVGHFGVGSYQGSARYLDWLYRANPAGRGLSDCLVARRDGTIVGCMHRMILPLEGPTGTLRFGCLHNHFVTDALRSGPGVLLLRRAVKDLDSGFAPGVQAPLDEVYRKLGFIEHPGFWMMRILDPVAAALQLARARLGGRARLRIDAARLSARFPGIDISIDPGASILEKLCRAMRSPAVAPVAGTATIGWTPALVRWRYFDPLGPQHLLLSSAGGDSMAVVALGMRRGLAVARLMEFAGSANASFLREVVRVLRAAGAALGFAFTTARSLADQLAHEGWRLRGNGTYSFRVGAAPLALGSGATDVGFEAFGAEFH